MKVTPRGERLDRFELIAELASGGMATVYLARLGGVAGFQRFVAIKRLHPHLARETEFVDMFLDEARLAARIHHPNVVSILEIGDSPEGYYLVMEYIEGDTAARLLARSTQAGYPFPVPIALRIVLDTLTGLHAAHEVRDDERRSLELVHRDVSPQNILVGVNGVARITDFGVARAATRLSTTRSGQLKGKLAYMAPEQARGSGVDRRADIFAMGAVMWEVLAARRLFKGEGEAETLNRVLFEPIPSLRAFEPSIPPAVEQICMCALSRDPNGRFRTAADMADALERVARSLNCLASARDVATFVDATVGEEIAQQRDAVRAWLARSEPSRNDPIVVPAARSGASSSASYPKIASPPPVPASFGSPPHPAGSASSSTVTGVSSAVLPSGSVPPNAFSSSPPPRAASDAPPAATAARGSRSMFVWVALAAAMGLAAGGFFVVYPRAVASSSHDEATSLTVPTAPAPSQVPPSSRPVPDSLATFGDADVEAAPNPSGARVMGSSPATPPIPPTKPTSGKSPAPTLHGGSPRTSGGKASTPLAPSNPADEPDDISRNPYR